ncbi:hypothetical protein PO002_35915 [Cupriavidus necator]|uniref:hypothetical protein n=1 Tax=Cupriavidus necator TaxID=106590 RepID=UPI0039C41B50
MLPNISGRAINDIDPGYLNENLFQDSNQLVTTKKTTDTIQRVSGALGLAIPGSLGKRT